MMQHHGSMKKDAQENAWQKQTNRCNKKLFGDQIKQ